MPSGLAPPPRESRKNCIGPPTFSTTTRVEARDLHHCIKESIVSDVILPFFSFASRNPRGSVEAFGNSPAMIQTAYLSFGRKAGLLESKVESWAREEGGPATAIGRRMDVSARLVIASCLNRVDWVDFNSLVRWGKAIEAGRSTRRLCARLDKAKTHIRGTNVRQMPIFRMSVYKWWPNRNGESRTILKYRRRRSRRTRLTV